MGIFDKLFGRNRRSFDELMDEYYAAGRDYISRRIDEKVLLKRQLGILKRAAKVAKDDKQKLTVNACLREVEGLKRAIQAGVVRR